MTVAVFFFLGLANAADSSASAWNDFSNNFATDIAPLVTLFGEQVTKQFLSESTGLLDNIIFGMAPLGILTAVVSAIRIYGWPSLKAFVGRAHEPHGVAEAELCTSTSRDVCELWSEGGICRVFGRPKILEFFYKPGEDEFYPKFSASTTEKEVEEPGFCNLYRPACFLVGNGCCRKGRLQMRHEKTPGDHGCDEKDPDWREKSTASSADSRDPPWSIENGDERMNFAPYPNLSLNIGISATPQWVLVIVTVFGFLVQLSFFGYATVITFYREDLYEVGAMPQTWSFVLAVLGTAMVVSGMILCAFLIERKSRERLFADDGYSGTDDIKVDTTMYWLQPGNQRVGDQQFNAFAHNKVKHTYITSWKTDQGRDQLGQNYINLILVLALFFSVVGFILQFIGLRGLHGSVALYQIAMTLLMSIVRAVLRLRRLDPNDNSLRSLGSKIEGHELDWQAMDTFADHPGRWTELANQEEYDSPIRKLAGFYFSSQIKRVKNWRLYDERGQSPSKSVGVYRNSVEQITSNSRNVDSGLWGFRNSGKGATSVGPKTWSEGLDCANEAVQVSSRYEGVFREGGNEYLGPNPAAMVALVRSRLAYLTGDGITGVQPKWDSPARSVAQNLQLAIQGLANYVLSGNIPIKDSWQNILALTWHTTAAIDFAMSDTPEPLWISFPMFQYGREWKISKYRLEAVISLWASSLDGDNASENLNDKALLVRDTEEQSQYSTLKLWMPAGNLKLLDVDDGSPNWTEAWLVQERRLLREQAEWDGCFDHSWLITMRAKSPRIKLLAQNIFTIFISRLADIIHSIDIPDEDLSSVWGLPHAELQTIGSSQRFHGLSNSHIKSMTKLFVQSGLGTEEEALMCIVPVFIQAGILPGEDTVMNKLLRWARKLRRDKQFRRAETILKAMLDNANPIIRQKVLREIGEVYRKAYREEQVHWALDGLQQMSHFKEVIVNQTVDNVIGPTLKDWPKPYRPTPLELIIFNRYGSLAKSIQKHGQSKLNASILRDHLKSQLRSGSDRSTEILTVAMKVELNGLPQDTAGNLLLLSIRNSCPELVDDLLDTHQGLVMGMILGSPWNLDEVMKPKVDMLVMETILDHDEVRIDSPYDRRTGEMVLSLAIGERRPDIVRLLLNRGAPVNMLSPAGRAIFCCVADKDNKALSAKDTQEFMTLLLDKGADVNATSNDNNTVVKRACMVGNHRAVKILVERRANLRNQMLLNEAARRGDREMLQILLEAGLDSEINKPASSDLAPPPVHVIKDYQLPSGLAPLSPVTSTDGTALHSAIEANRGEIVEVLLRSECNINMRIDGDLGYAIIIACFLGRDKILDMLLAVEPPVDINVVSEIGSALAIACARGATDMARKLLSKGAKAKQPGGKLGSPLVLACLQGLDSIVEELLKEESTEKNDVGSGGLTALCAAVKISNHKIVHMLLKHGADVDLQGTQGTTPLLIAVSNETVDIGIVNSLLQAKADPNKRGGEETGNLTPLEMCREWGNNQVVVEALKHAGAHDPETPSAELKRWWGRKEKTNSTSFGRTSSISFGNSNSGLQVGINQGQVYDFDYHNRDRRIILEDL